MWSGACKERADKPEKASSYEKREEAFPQNWARLQLSDVFRTQISPSRFFMLAEIRYFAGRPNSAAPLSI